MLTKYSCILETGVGGVLGCKCVVFTITSTVLPTVCLRCFALRLEFRQNRHKYWETLSSHRQRNCDKDTHTDTDTGTHTYTHTHRHTPKSQTDGYVKITTSDSNRIKRISSSHSWLTLLIYDTGANLFQPFCFCRKNTFLCDGCQRCVGRCSSSPNGLGTELMQNNTNDKPWMAPAWPKHRERLGQFELNATNHGALKRFQRVFEIERRESRPSGNPKRGTRRANLNSHQRTFGVCVLDLCMQTKPTLNFQ